MNDPSDAYIFDSFALLAYLEDEVSAGRVATLLRKAEEGKHHIWMSIINLGEVLYIVEREQNALAVRKTLAAVEQLPIEIVDADRTLALAAAHLKANFAISYADAFAVALGQEKRACIATGDPEFKQVEKLVPIEWLERTDFQRKSL